MHKSQDLNLLKAIVATTATNATTTLTVDTLNAVGDYLIVASLPVASATNSSYTWSILDVKTADTTSASQTTLVDGTATLTVPVGNVTNVASTVGISVPQNACKRYLFVTATPSASLSCGLFAFSGRSSTSPADSNNGFGEFYTDV